ncbi:transcriptional repressor [Acinetobacter beijerinckii]|uniref:Fur family transcriptional regulator n=1 Tax=Acinetobacter beijerinckii TaxID=262668 RepID=UPI0023DDA4EB|nr:transcriptional repressor [Acinetobacter beijerinckii]MDF2418308.1 transcriptional repressor [Acinetobacter beijerinckii]
MLEPKQKIKQAGLRVTHPRIAVLSLLTQQKADLTVKQIYQRLNLQKQQLSLPTVYRVVSDLVLAGLLVSYQFHRAETKFNLPNMSKNQLLQIYCADLIKAKRGRFLQSLEAVFNQFQIDLMQIEIKEST